jgi:aminocarboxymuconate-semialdehyde decarboxylase
VEESLRIDIHSHFMPRNFYYANRRGREWYGASVARGAQGNQVVLLNSGIELPLPAELNIWSSPEKRLEICKEREGIDVQVLSLRGSFWNYHLDAGTGAAFCREVNEELAELQKTFPKRFIGLAMVPWQDTRTALKELEYAVKNLGLRGVCLSTNINGRNLDDPALLPIFKAVASEGLFVFCHPNPPIAGDDRMSGYAFNNTVGLPLETTLAIMSLVFGGVLDKYPSLKICFCQGGGYSVYGVGRLSHGYHNKREAGTMKRPPEEYLAMLYYDCLIHNAESLQFLIDRVSIDHVLLGTDFPFDDGIAGGTTPWIEKMSFLSAEDKRKILGANAGRLLGMA